MPEEQLRRLVAKDWNGCNPKARPSPLGDCSDYRKASDESKNEFVENLRGLGPLEAGRGVR